MFKDPLWLTFGLELLGAIGTVLLITWRVSAIVTRHEANTAARMREHELKDESAFRAITQALTQGGESIRNEFGTTVATLRTHMQQDQAKTVERIHKVETSLASNYISKDAFYSSIREFNEQTRRNFDEIKEWLRRFDEKVDAIRDRGHDSAR